jgi:transcriptional regulator with XRE-family HTH domain
MARLKGIDAVVGERLRKLREANGLSREKLAERAGRSASFVAKLELGEGRGRLETWAQMAKALGYTLAELFTDPSAATGAREPVALRRLSGAHHDQLNALVAHARALEPEPLQALITIARHLASQR